MYLDDLLEQISILYYLFYLSLCVIVPLFQALLSSFIFLNDLSYKSLSELLQIDTHLNYEKTLYEIKELSNDNKHSHSFLFSLVAHHIRKVPSPFPYFSLLFTLWNKTDHDHCWEMQSSIGYTCMRKKREAIVLRSNITPNFQ